MVNSLGKSTTLKEDTLKSMDHRFKTVKREMFDEISRIFERVPKLQRIQHKFTNEELQKIFEIQKRLQMTAHTLETVLKRYPFILKLDIEKDIVPRYEVEIYTI